MISLRARLVRYLARRYFDRITTDSDLAELRFHFEQMARRLRLPRGVSVRHARIAGLDCDWLVPAGAEAAPLLYYLHGGAYVMGSSHTHRHMVGHIAREAGVRALLPNYRLAPECPYPAAIDDAVAVYRALLGEGEDPARLVFGGDSAGGGLAMATLLTLREAGDPLPAAVVLLSPWLDLAGEGESMRTRADADPLFRAGDMPEVAAFYCDRENLRDPRVSPVHAELGGLPPIFIQVGDDEILLSDATRLSDGVSAQIWPELWHVFQFFAGQMPEANRAVGDIAAFIGRVLEPAAKAQ